MAKYPDGSRHIVTGGGRGTLDTTTWIYDIDSGIDLWRPITADLELTQGSSVQFGDTFLAVGGELNDGTYTDTRQIWEFNADPLDEKWIQRPEQLTLVGYSMAAFMVPNDYATC